MGPAPPTDQLDLLFMIDNSGSMTEEQASLVSEVPRLIQALASGDRDGDGVADFTPIGSLHVGLVTSDLGCGDILIARCPAGFGDDGLMQIAARHPGASCQPDYASLYPDHVFTFEATASTSAADFGMDVGCVLTFGTDGAGRESELEAPLKALSLTPQADGSSPVGWTRAGYRPPIFWAGRLGHGDDPATNGAFLRPESVLAILTLNDEDDCSTPTPNIYSPDDPRFNTVDLNLRCHEFADELYPVQRYVDGFIGLRRHAGRLVYGAITGVPPAVSGMDPATILAHPAMTETINPAMVNQLLPACSIPGRGVAYPAIRMTQVAEGLRALGAHTTVHTICSADFGPALDAFLDEIIAASSQ